MEASPLERRIVDNVEQLLSSCSNDARAVGMLSEIREDFRHALRSIPDRLKNDLSSVLHLLVDSKSDNAQLWTQLLQVKDEIAAVHKRASALEEQLALVKSNTLATCRRHIRNTASEVMQQALRKGFNEAEPVVGQGRYKYKWKQEREQFKTSMRPAADALQMRMRDLAYLGSRVTQRRNVAIHGVSRQDLDDARKHLKDYPELAEELKDEGLVVYAAFESHEWWEGGEAADEEDDSDDE